jgi:chromosome partitioning protein
MAQGTSQAWHTRRVGNALPSIGDVSHFRTVEEALVDADNYDIVVIDSRGYTSEATLPIARVADMVIQPTGASLDDLEPAVRLFHELTDKGISLKRLFFALSRVITQAEIDHTRAYLSQTPYQMLDGYLSEQPGYRLALNSGLSALETPFESLNQRTDHLIQSLFNHFDILINDHGNVQN